ncbi:hypothetical protein K7X08_004459 [Anisodus acutangulus]|uniref:E3 ubiquitin-protein ligase n=1 Tax=Anisodus acutangulus TaxID=402998 RepID=A0A9Q1MDU2_9SOLA|nr:hypothetical protein K7X08_004459 [Anisodus acutangulus]
MDIDSSPESYTLTHMDRILQRLDSLEVPAENLEQLQLGLVAYVKNNKSQMGELVSALLPTNEEAIEWLMFDGEPSRALEQLADTGQRGVCGAVWGNNDIAYRCRTCEHDPTCAICVPCFQNGNHKDHNYSIIYTGGGSCDCGDVTAWKREGFCSKHKGAEQIQPLPEEFANSMGPVLDLLLSCWRKRLLFPESISGKNPRGNDHTTELKTVTDELTSAVVEMLLTFCKHSESLLSFISRRISSSAGLLDILVRAERFMITEEDVKKIHELLLKLLGEPQFKYEFAKVFLSYCPTVVNEAVRECNDTVFNKYPLLSTFSVQIFTVPTLTPRLVKEMNLLPMLLGCLGDILVSCTGEDGKLQVMKWADLYETTLCVVEDIRFVMSHSIVPRYVAHDRQDILRTWMKLLAFVQGTDPQKRETGIHVEEENENMHLPFVLEDAWLSQESSVCSMTGRSPLEHASRVPEVKYDRFPVSSSVLCLTFDCLRAIENWLIVDNTSGPLLNILCPKTSSTPGNNFSVLKKTLSKFRRGREIFKSQSPPSNDVRLSTSAEGYIKQYSYPSLNCRTTLDSGQSSGQEAARHGGHDDSMLEGDNASELEALRGHLENVMGRLHNQDTGMHRGKPLYLNEERYAALTHMVASHGIDRSPKVLHQMNIGKG